MKRQPRILAGTALGLLMASAPLGAFPLQGSAAFDPTQGGGTPLILAQDAPTDEAQPTDQEQPRKKKRDQQAQQAPAEQAAPAAEQPAPPAEEQQPRKKKHEQQQQAEQAPAEQAAPAEEQQPRRKKRDQQQQTEQAPAEQAAPAEEQQPRRKKRDQQQQTEQAPAEQAAPAEEQQPRKKKRDQQQQTEQAPAEQAAPAEEQQPRKKKRDQQQQTEQAPAEQAPAGETQPANDNQPVKPGKKHKQEQQKEAPTAPAVTPEAAPTPKEAPAGQAVTPKVEPAPAGEQPATQGEQPQDKTKKHGRKPAGEQPANGEQPATGEQPQTGKQPATGEQPANGVKPATGEQPANGNTAAPAQGENPVQGEAPADKNAAPILDSQKDAQRKGGGRKHGDQNGQQNGEQQNGGQNAQQGGDQGQKPVVAPVDQGPPPTDDKAAQQEIKPEKLVPVTEEKGKRLDRAPDENIRDRRRPKGVDVLKEIGDRVIIQLGGQTIVQSNEGSRMNRGAKDVYYEDLSQGRTRETVQRDNGVQIVTIRNRYGDVIQRSRITPDGREYVLSYVDERNYQDDGDWRDPGDDLPPMRLNIPRRQYILDSEDVQSDDDYYTFLDQPPVERVQRLYSIDEVKRSARVRDIARRVDLDTLNFEFGSSSISDTEVQKLEGVASAMEKLLKKNPAETFLIEGHTDAVGTPEANLALSDRRAEAVAEALTNAFGIPPENLTTQGYGEQYLKVNTSAPNRENRRVAIRRITSLVAPVASNN
ncbi:flagellar motor protein MotB [Mesorhizobium loti]|uniref:Flagellar motor protein MotB n=1 Tax=Mesorhizobium jarvisii TaxID=1777867 RepID=A0A6M7TGU2_9HYPH|nr:MULTISPECIES: OmpA family protein [Mesorhizobium]OBQ75625.1 flagellar motor protein MotB [Mesorhizobium loti]QKC63013.1 flagellar motor protein MotB [Mesorhizobium jarvisii]QKD08924.1 flagellar motor protein MotB [Mesorhizobium loti]RJT33655.1 flagellar motor protein MotB [Mesorhizobium jarvisii]BCH00644.1 flagellar motor protein MotB [Mesorhizobium sp. 131-2-5]